MDGALRVLVSRSFVAVTLVLRGAGREGSLTRPRAYVVTLAGFDECGSLRRRGRGLGGYPLGCSVCCLCMYSKVFSGPLVVFVPGFPWHVMCASLEVFIFVRFICRKVGAAL